MGGLQDRDGRAPRQGWEGPRKGMGLRVLCAFFFFFIVHYVSNYTFNADVEKKQKKIFLDLSSANGVHGGKEIGGLGRG